MLRNIFRAAAETKTTDARLELTRQLLNHRDLTAATFLAAAPHAQEKCRRMHAPDDSKRDQP